MSLSRLDRWRSTIGFVFVLTLLTLFVSCGDDSPTEPTANRAPSIPAIGVGAPAHEATDVALTTDLQWSCSDPDGDPLTYSVYFGTAADPPLASGDQAANSYAPAGMLNSTTYYWKVVASDDAEHSTSSPVWNFTTAALPSETVTAPGTPVGPATGEIAQDLSYTVSSGTSGEGHAVEHRFDWGDGTDSAWASTTMASHSWANAGDYDVSAQARCAIHNDAESGWSTTLTVTVTGPEAVSTPNAPVGPATGVTGATIRYDVTGATCSLGHPVDVRFDWGIGSPTAWTSASWGATQWIAADTYDVIVQARCHENQSVESDWSAATQVIISDPAEVLGPISISVLAASSAVGLDELVRASGGSSSLGHATEGRFDWGNGVTSAWVPKSGLVMETHYTWPEAGTFEVRAETRCIAHPDITALSDPEQIVIAGAETVSTPTLSPTPEATVAINTWLTIQATANSSAGHYLEWWVDTGDGAPYGWVSGVLGTNEFYRRWSAPGDYQVRVKARCNDHPDIESEWSDYITVHVTATGPSE